MKISVAAKDAALEFDADPGERLLYAGLRAGMPLAYECGSGTCGSCRATVLEGTVEDLWPDAPGLTADKRNAASILLCQSSATGACRLAADKITTPPHPDCVPAYHDGVVVARETLTHDTLLVTIALPRKIVFAAGQFVLMSVDGIPGWRAYSIVEGEATDRPSFVIKLKQGGRMTRWLFEECGERARVRLFGPLGAATLRPETDRDMLILAGGSGVSMALALLDGARRCGHLERNRADVVFGVRTPNDAFCLDRLSAHALAEPIHLQITVAFSEPCDTGEIAAAWPMLGFERGYVHEVAERVIIAPDRSATGFIAGPPPMIDASLRYMLLKARLPVSRLRYDKFS